MKKSFTGRARAGVATLLLISGVVLVALSLTNRMLQGRALREPGSQTRAAASASLVSPGPLSFSHNTIVDFSATSGEPFINAAPVAVAPNTPAGAPFISVPFGVSTTVSLLWKSIDGGRTFIPLGTPITRDAVTAPGGGDTHQDFDVKGRFYYSDLSAACVTTAVSDDGGNTFPKVTPLACVGPGDPSAATDDRQWVGAFGDGRGYMTVRNLAASVGQNFHLNRTRDAGLTWPNAQQIGTVTQSGPLVVDKTKRNIGGADYILGYQMYYSGTTLKMLRIQDPDTGANPTIVDLTIGAPGGAIANVFPVPALDNAGNIYATWSNGSAIFMATSIDRGASWSAPKRVSPTSGDGGTGTIIMPWIAAGDPGRVDVVWYRGLLPGNSTSNDNRWDIYMGQTLNAFADSPSWSYAKVSENTIHFGQICLQGLNCDLAVPPGSQDRSFLEFPSITIDNRGAAMITYNDNTNQSAVTAANPAVTGAPYVMFSKQVCGPSLYASVGEIATSGPAAITLPANGATLDGPVTVRGTHTLPPSTFDRDEKGDAKFPASGPVIGSNVPALDIQQVDLTEDATNIIVHMQLADATSAALTNATGTAGGDGLLYLVQWDYDESPADPIDRVFWVAAEVRGGTPVGRTGTLGVIRSATSKKYITYNPDVQKSAQVGVTITNSAPGTITLTIPRSLAGNPPNGAQLKSVTGYAMSERGPLAATPCPEPPASCENVFDPTSLPIMVDASGAFTYVVGGGMQLDGTVEISLDDPTFSNHSAATINRDGTWFTSLGTPSAGAHTVYARQIVRDCAGSPVVSVAFAIAAPPAPSATPTPAASPAQLLNISTRARVQTDDNVLIGGFIVTGAEAKNVIVRAIGPSLASNGQPVAGRLADPVLELHDASGALIIGNDNWKDSQQAEIEATGLAPSNDSESAIVRKLNPGAYTAVMRGKNNSTGIGLVEAYDLSVNTNSRLANISTRGFVETGDNVMIGGLILGNNPGPATIILRSIGPSLARSNVSTALQDPLLELHEANGALIASNDDWQADPNASQVQLSGLGPADSRESALLVSLPPAKYTAITRGKNDSTGVALVEAYHLAQ